MIKMYLLKTDCLCQSESISGKTRKERTFFQTNQKRAKGNRREQESTG
jgi:hypothetical protein